MASSLTKPVVIIGAGLAGLTCAERLQAAGIPYMLLDADNQVGGRVQSDIVQGWVLDRGFQVLLQAYPTARRYFDDPALKLCSFQRGALCWDGDRFLPLYDPLHHPLKFLGSLRTPIWSLADALAIAKLRLACRSLRYEDYPREGRSTAELFHDLGFSEYFRSVFLEPFFRGILLESSLTTDASYCKFLFALFARGPAVIPAAGIGALSRTIAVRLESKRIRLSSAVATIGKDSLTLIDGTTIDAARIVLAVNAEAAAKFLNTPTVDSGKGTDCLYFSLPHPPPIGEPVLILNGSASGIINNLHFPSALNPEPPGGPEALCSVTVLRDNPERKGLSPEELATKAQRDLIKIFGKRANDWKLLKHYVIPHALPNLPDSTIPRAPEGVVLCGDYRTHPSIEGAIISGLEAARRVLLGS